MLTGLAFALGLSVSAQTGTSASTYKVLGNCGMCEKTIEKAALKKGVTKADWDKNTKILTLEFDAAKTSADEILKNVAKAGYDNEKYKGSDVAYSKLPECCQYERVAVK